MVTETRTGVIADADLPGDLDAVAADAGTGCQTGRIEAQETNPQPGRRRFGKLGILHAARGKRNRRCAAARERQTLAVGLAVVERGDGDLVRVCPRYIAEVHRQHIAIATGDGVGRCGVTNRIGAGVAGHVVIGVMAVEHRLVAREQASHHIGVAVGVIGVNQPARTVTTGELDGVSAGVIDKATRRALAGHQHDRGR